jgi:hypothetical protein
MLMAADVNRETKLDKQEAAAELMCFAHSYERFLLARLDSPLKLYTHLKVNRTEGLAEYFVSKHAVVVRQLLNVSPSLGGSWNHDEVLRAVGFWEKKIFLKGFAYSIELYGGLFDRRFTDVDIFIDHDDRHVFFKEAIKRGWVPLKRNFAHPNSLQSNWLVSLGGDKKCIFDVHNRISNCPVLFDVISFRDAWDNARALSNGNGRWLGAHFSLLHSAIHYLGSCPSDRSDVSLLDIAMLWRVFSESSEFLKFDEQDRGLVQVAVRSSEELYGRTSGSFDDRFGGIVDLKRAQRVRKYHNAHPFVRSVFFGSTPINSLERFFNWVLVQFQRKLR